MARLPCLAHVTLMERLILLTESSIFCGIDHHLEKVRFDLKFWKQNALNKKSNIDYRLRCLTGIQYLVWVCRLALRCYCMTYFQIALPCCFAIVVVWNCTFCISFKCSLVCPSSQDFVRSRKSAVYSGPTCLSV